jgi:hypothetical protein
MDANRIYQHPIGLVCLTRGSVTANAEILKSAASLVTGLALAATAAIDTTTPAGAATRCSVTFQTYSPIKKGSTGDQAKALECLLAKAGFSTTVNGRF